MNKNIFPATFPALSSLALACALAFSSGLAHGVTVPEQDVHDEYDHEQVAFSSLTEFLVGQIVVDTEEDANQALQRLAAGDSFDTVARHFSKDMASKGKGGDLGWALPEKFYPEIEKSIKAMKPGEISKTAIKTKLGWHILQVRDTRKFVFDSYETARAKLQKSLADRYDRIDSLAKVLAQQRQEREADKIRTQYLVSHILTATLEEAKAAQTRIENGELFESVARAVSTDAGSAQKGGDLGWSEAKGYQSEIRAALLHLNKGDITHEPVATPYGYHIILLRDTKVEVRDLVSLPPSAEQKELESFFFSVPNGPEVVRHLLDAGISPNTLYSGGPALGYFCHFGYSADLRALLAGGADPNLAKVKFSALDGCLSGEKAQENTALLLKAGARVDIPDGIGYYPLSAAASMKNPALVRQILLSGAAIDQHNNDGTTALSSAAAFDSADVVRTLLEFGANPLEPLQPKIASPNNTGLLTALSAAANKSPSGQAPTETLTVLRKAASDMAKAHSIRSLTVYVVQGASRQAIVNGRSITLKRAPFSLDFVMRNGNGVMIHASNSRETTEYIGQHLQDGKFGDANYQTNDDSQENSAIVVSDLANFHFHHWISTLGKTQFETHPGANGEIKARRVVKTLIYQDEAHDGMPDSSKSSGVENIDKPLYLVLAVGEPIGNPFTAVTQLLSTQINWR